MSVSIVEVQNACNEVNKKIGEINSKIVHIESFYKQCIESIKSEADTIKNSWDTTSETGKKLLSYIDSVNDDLPLYAIGYVSFNTDVKSDKLVSN